MSTPPRINRVLICPPAPRRPIPPPPPPTTTPIVIMQIDMRDADEDVKDDDESHWMRSNLYFTTREAMANYFTNLFNSGGGNGFENAILLDIEENSSLEKFLEKIASSKDVWEINKNLSVYVYSNVIIN